MKICPVCSREFAAGETHCPDDGIALVALSTTERGRPEELIGKVVEGRYRVERIVGKGGMGTVYAARHVVVGKAVALKVLRATVDQTKTVLERFVREAQTSALLKSRHIVEINDFGQLPNGLFFVVMELLEGRDLTRAMKPGELNRAELIHVFIQIAEALAGAHEQGIVHRDLKPDNVFLVNEADDPLFVKLLDFGIAKLLDGNTAGLTETGVILGTPYYMSPEQARAEQVDHRTDIYALGVMMYRAFTGRLPFIADSTMGVITRHLSDMPEPPSKISAIHPKAELLILRCMEKRPEQRPQSMREVVIELRAMLLEEQRRGGRIREDPTVNALGQGGGIPAAPAVPPGAFMPQGNLDPRVATGPHPTGGYPSGSYPGPHQSGPHPSGSYPGPHQSGPHPSGSYPGPHQSGPHPSGAYANPVTPSGAYPSVAMLAGGHVTAGGRAHVGGASPESSVTSLHWPGSPGATTPGLATSSSPAPTQGRGALTMGIVAVVMLAAGAIAAAVFFGVRPHAAAEVVVASAAPVLSAPVASAPASAAASSSASEAPAPPVSATSPEVASTATAASQGRPSGRPRGAPPPPPTSPPAAAVTAKPSASAPVKRSTTDIRSPFD